MNWISSERVRTIDDDAGISTVYEYLDFLFDAYLWHLPIPRYIKKYDEMIYSSEIFVENIFDNSFISVLKDRSLDSETHAFVVVLMILDYDLLSKIPKNVVYKKNFLENARKCILEEFTFDFNLSTLEFLRKFNSVLIARALNYLEKVPDGFIRVCDVEKSLLSDDFVLHYNNFLLKSECGTSRKFLEDLVYVRNLVDEVPEFVLCLKK